MLTFPRVFSEKMGLESGWNCHISLKSGPGRGKAPHLVEYMRGGGGKDQVRKHGFP